MKISSLFDGHRPILSFEIFPPKKDAALQNIDATLEILAKLRPDFISVTFGAGGEGARNRTIELAAKIKHQYDIEPLVHMTCLGYGREEIDRLVEALDKQGLQNVLALRGDAHPDLPPRQDFGYAQDLTAYLRAQGDFCVGGACYPEKHPESPDRIRDIHRLREKVDRGADFLISQLFFENALFMDFVEDARIAGIQAPILAGIMPVINKAQIQRIVSLCGASVPERFRRIMDRFEFDKEALFDAGMAYALAQIIDLLAVEVDGIHLYTMNNPVVARRICEGIEHILPASVRKQD